MLAALEHQANSGRLSFHMPGHRGGQSWPTSVRQKLASLDTTELRVTDDLHAPTGPARQAMQLAADFFGAGQTLFLTNGATGGILAMLAGLVGRGRKLILPRTCHLSVSHALALLEIVPCWIELDAPASLPQPLGLLPEVTAEAVSRAIAFAPDSAAVLLTCPDYYGRCADLAAIAQVVHASDLLLLVDEAHGAHFAAAPDLLPVTAMTAGADACVQSAHKTLPALTQGAYLHVSACLLDQLPAAADRVRAALRVFQTSSPSFAIAASLDFARAYLEQTGHVQIERLLGEIRYLSNALHGDWQVSQPTRLTDEGWLRDPVRIVLHRPGRFGPATSAAAILSEAGIDIELADLTRLVLIPSLDQPHRDFARLAETLQRLPADPVQIMPPNLEDDWIRLMTAVPERVVPSGQVLFGLVETRQIALAASLDQVAAVTITPYPPGIPLILPGERIDAARLDLLIRLRENKITLAGVDREQVRVVV